MATRKFNGKTYQEYTFSTNKKDAEYICDNIRKSGMLARFAKSKNGYTIYARKG